MLFTQRIGTTFASIESAFLRSSTRKRIFNVHNMYLWFQQYGSPAHFTITVRQLLNIRYPCRCISRGASSHGHQDLLTWCPSIFTFWDIYKLSSTKHQSRAKKITAGKHFGISKNYCKYLTHLQTLLTLFIIIIMSFWLRIS